MFPETHKLCLKWAAHMTCKDTEMLHPMSQITSPPCAFRPRLIRRPCFQSEIQHQPAANPSIPDPPLPEPKRQNAQEVWASAFWVDLPQDLNYIFPPCLSVYIVNDLDHKCNRFLENPFLDVLKQGVSSSPAGIYTLRLTARSAWFRLVPFQKLPP